MLTWVNGQPDPWPRSTPKSGFKTMIIIYFIIALTWVNDQPNPW